MNILRAELYLKRYLPSTLVSEVFDDDEMLQWSLEAMFPSLDEQQLRSLTVGQLLVQYAAAPVPIHGQAPSATPA